MRSNRANLLKRKRLAVIIQRSIRFFLAGLILMGLNGCVGFFDAKPTEVESQNILRDVETIKPNPNITVPKPEMYSRPPEILDVTISGAAQAKLLYFCRFHRAESLIGLIQTQFIAPLNDRKGAPIPAVSYTLSHNPATEQLIVTCPDRKHAEQLVGFLREVDVPPIQIKIDCLISEVYADHTMDWESSMEIQNLFGKDIQVEGMLPGAAIRDIARQKFGLKAGTIYQEDQPGHRVSALVDMLVSRGYLKILMNPQLEVLNGQKAMIKTMDLQPLDQISSINQTTGVATFRREYANIIDSLEIIPQVFADGTIGLQTKAVIGSKSTPEGVKQLPIVTRREIDIKENRVRSGESLVIGGIQKTEQRSVVRGIPFFKDLPLIGILFSSKDFEERGKEVLFIITPTISTGGLPNEEILAELRLQHKPMKQEGVFEKLTDPFGDKAYTGLVEEEATRAEVERIKAEMDKAEAERRVRVLEDKLAQTSHVGEAFRGRADSATTAEKVAADSLEAEKQKAAAAIAERDKVVAENQKKMEAAKAAAAEAQKTKKDTEAEIAEWMKAHGIKPAEKPATPAPAPGAPAK